MTFKFARKWSRIWIFYSYFYGFITCLWQSFFLQVHLNNCAYKIVDKQIIDYPGDNQELMNELDPAKSNHSKECMVYYYWFFNHGFKYLDYVCNGCNDLLMMILAIYCYHCC